MVDVIVSYKVKPSKAEKEATKPRIADLREETKHAYGKLSMRSLSVPASTLDDLAKEEDVKFISLDSALGQLTRPELDNHNKWHR